MLVNKNDYLVRIKDNAVFRVILADAEEFAIARAYYDAKNVCWTTDYGAISAYPNTETEYPDFDSVFKKANKKVA